MTSRFIRSLSLVFLLVGMCACDKTTTEPTPTPTSATYLGVLLPSSLTLGVGDATQMRSVAVLRDATYQVVTSSATWASSAATIATVDAGGVVRAIAPGTATVTVTLDTLTATSTVTVTAASSTPPTFWGGLSLGGGETATLKVSLDGAPRASASVFLPRGVLDLVGRIDAPTGIVTLAGNGYTFSGTLADGVLRGTFVDPSGVTGGFVAIDATRTAVSTFCGKYVSGGVTSGGNADTGSVLLAASLDGVVAGTALVSDASAAPIVAIGRRTGSTFASTSADNVAINGVIQSPAASGSFQTRAGTPAGFNASVSACH